MKKLTLTLTFFIGLLAIFSTWATSLNIYITGAEIPLKLIADFQKETGIRVNVSTYDNNETMYAKLRASKKNRYDILLPSSYYVERLKKYGMLTKIDPSRLQNFANIDPNFANNPFDPNNEYHIPLVWGTTGLFYNQHWVQHPPITWHDLWHKRWAKQLLLLDDVRDVFSISLMSLGYDPNDTNLEHIREAYEHLLSLVPNIKLFANDTIQSVMIDEDVYLGSTWSGSAYKAQTENRAIQYVYPRDGFVIWVDCIAIPKNAPHLQEAYQFIDYLLRAESGVRILSESGFAVANQASQKQLAPPLQHNLSIFPDQATLARGHFQRDVGKSVLEVLNGYWEKLKLAC